VRSVVAAGLTALIALTPISRLGAQLIDVPMDDERARPISVTGSVGYFIAQSRVDGVSGLAWYFGDAVLYRLSADMAFGLGTFGVSGAMASVPLQRGNSSASNGDIQLRQLMATFRSPEPRQFGQVIEIGVGLSQYANYSGTDAVTGDDAEPRNAFAFSLGYGFVIPLGQRFGVTLMQDYVTAIGSREGLPAGAKRSQEQYTTRLGLRWRVLGARP
jgi:hypothetical protein